MTRGPSRKSRAYARIRGTYPTYPNLESQGLSFVQIAEALGVGRQQLHKIKDAFEDGKFIRSEQALEIEDGIAEMEARRSREERLRSRHPTFPELVAQGHTRHEIMQALDIGDAMVDRLRRAFAIKGKSAAFPGAGAPKGAGPGRPKKEYPDIEEALRAGGSYQSIGDEFGLCRERVRQIAKSLGIKKVRAKPCARARTASGLTLYQQRLVEKCPDILNPNIPPREVTQASEFTVYKIRTILGISFISSRITIKERLVSVIDRTMSIHEISSALGSISMNTLSMYLCWLTRDGRIKRISRGVYAPAKDLP